MPRQKIKQDVLCAATKLRRSETLLGYRRLNWEVETCQRIYDEFQAFIVAARDVDFPIEFRLEHYEAPNAGVIQIHARPSFTGVVDRAYRPDLDGTGHVDTRIYEEDGDLVASLSPTGFVHFSAHPRRSIKLKSKEAQIILMRGYDPVEVTPKVIHRALRSYLLILQRSSLIGIENSLTLKERLVLLWIRFMEVRNRTEVIRSLLSMKNEWGKIAASLMLPVIVSWLVIVLTKS